MTGYTFSQLFDFTRTTAGTFVGSNGLIQNTPASVNLLTFTQEFDNAAWTKDRVTVSANVTIAPDGTSTADKVVDTAAGLNTYRIYNSLTLSAVSYTQTFYAKAAEYSWCYIRIGSAVRAWFDLTNGTVGTVEAGLTASITPAGNGWYRIACTIATATAGAGFGLIGLATGNNVETYTPTTGGMGIFIWGAQLEVGSTATTYTRNNGGVFPARFDYDPVTLAPRGILIEEQRTNLLLQSNAFSSAPWGPDTNTIMTANSAVSPDGTTNAWKMAAVNGVISNGQRQFNTKAASAITYTTSLFSKAAGYDWLQIAVFDGTNGNRYWFNVRTGAVGTTSVIGTGFTAVSASVTPAPNGFFHCAIIATSSTATQYDVYLYPAAANGSNGTGNANGDGVFIYGAQLEVGAFATSYIPTVASQVTRSADICNITAPMFAPWYNQSAGTFLVEYTQGSGTTARAATVASDGTNSNTVELYIDGSNDATTLPFYGVYVAGAAQAALSFAAATQNATHKMGAAYQANDFAGSVDGASVVTDTSGTLPTVNRLSIGSSGTAATAFANGHIRRVTYYPFRASNNQLQALTT
jgi:hypothetical protein